MQILAALLLMSLVAAPAYAQSCDDESIQSVSDDGSIIIMISGTVFQVNPVDQVDTALWLAADDVLVCDDEKIINKDENGETASVRRLR
jgi:hypothetical protein